MKRKDSTARDIQFYENKYYSWNKSSGLWALISHARAEWAKGNYSQCAKDLAEIKQIEKSLESVGVF